MTSPADLVAALHTDDFMLDPFPAWERLRHDAPVVWDAQGGCWVVTRYADVTGVLLDHETFSTKPYADIFTAVIGRTMVEMDGLDHDVLRNVVAPPLIGGKLQRQYPLIEQCVRELVDAAPRHGRIDLIGELTAPLPVMVVTALLGLNPEDHEYLATMVNEVIHALPGTEPERSVGIRAHQDFERYVETLVAQRIADPGDDLISAIGAASTAEAERLSPAEIASFISLLLVAGGETTDRAIANFWYLLLTRPDVLAAVRADESLIEAAITEFMRYDGVVVYEDRRTTREVTICGVDIPADALVRVALMSANNDETVFADPRTYILGRTDLRPGKENRAGGNKPGVSAHVGFGIGKHFCIGYQLARAEMTVATSRALDLLSRARISADEPPTMHVDWFHRYLDRLVVDVD